MPLSGVHFLSSGLLGVAVYYSTQTTLSALYKGVYQLRWKTSLPKRVVFGIGLLSLFSALFCALALHVILDYWPRVAAVAWWLQHGGGIGGAALEFRLWVEFFKIMDKIGLYDPATQTGLAIEIMKYYYHVTGGVVSP